MLGEKKCAPCVGCEEEPLLRLVVELDRAVVRAPAGRLPRRGGRGLMGDGRRAGVRMIRDGPALRGRAVAGGACLWVLTAAGFWGGLGGG